MQGRAGTRAAVYCRISQTDEKVDKVERQREACTAFAAKHGYTVVKVYEDDGFSAFKNVAREHYEQLTADAAAGKFEVIVAVRQDRLSRDWFVTAQLVHECQRKGIAWHTLVEGYNDLSEGGALLAVFNGFQASGEQTKKIASIKHAFDKRHAAGLPLWGVRPFGFEKDRVTHNDAEIADLRWAYSHVLSGGSLYAIQKRWNDAGITTTRGNAWSYATVRQLLMRPSNAGLLQIGTDDDNQPVISDVQAAWEPIVSRETWRDACALLRNPARNMAVNRQPKWLCAGLARCWCGSVMRSGSGSDRHGRFSIYRCAERRPGPQGKRHASIKPSDLDPLVILAIVDAFMYGAPGGSASEQADLAELRALYERLQQIEHARAQLVASLELPGITAATIAKPATVLKEEQDGIEARIDDHRVRSAHAAMLLESRRLLWQGADPATGKRRRPSRVSLAQAAQVKADLRERYDSLLIEQQRTLVRALLVVTVDAWTSGPSSGRVAIDHVGGDLGGDDLGGDDVVQM